MILGNGIVVAAVVATSGECSCFQRLAAGARLVAVVVHGLELGLVEVELEVDWTLSSGSLAEID